ncbi:ATP-dependent RNA helicase ROK1 [Smittium culicis]|uniref:RNA helicase n=1 Tax=Smittium culicis TaxID=133412 RepID=A0A1R1Y3U3_9FUNG|nr:ATP-dependent RNA helicase ROK1 [Smittium culicis]
MDTIRMLSMGANFNSKEFKHDIDLFKKKKDSSKNLSIVADDIIPEEIDLLNSKNQKNVASKDKNKLKNDDSDIGNTIKSFPNSENDLPFEDTQQVDAFRKENKIRIWGTDTPNPFRTFKMMQNRYSFGSYLEKNMVKCGFITPTPIQQQAVPISIDGRDLIACAPTGSGKTLSFLLPIIHHIESKSFTKDLVGLIISPTRELANQIHNQVQLLTPKKKISSYLLTKNPVANAMQDPKSRKKFNILIATPLRLVYAIKNQEIDLSTISHLVLDEADRLLDEGFIEQIDDILSACTSIKLQTSLYSATIPSMVEVLANRIMKDPVKVVIGTSNAATETIDQKLVFVGQEEGKLIEIRNMIQSGFKPPCLIFVQSIERAKELFFELVYDGINVEVMHAEKTKQQRDRIIENFKKGKLWILISTELMARGIDFKGVNLVINYDFPQSVASYIHRIGRTGRAGREGKAITYFTKEDAPYLKNIVNVMRQSGCEVPEWMLQLKNPDSTQKKNLKKRPIDRKSISTVSEFDKKNNQKRKNIIAQSKKINNKKLKKAD